MRSSDEMLLRPTISQDLDDHIKGLMKAYDSELARFVAAKVKSPDDQDVLQNIFLKAFTGLRRMSKEELQSLHLRSWLYEVARSAICDHYREQQYISSTTSISILDPDEQDIEDKTCDRPEELIEQADDQAERLRKLRALLALLPDEYRTQLVLRKLEDRRYDQIAAIVRQPEETVRAQVQNAMRRLRRAATSQQIRLGGIDEIRRVR